MVNMVNHELKTNITQDFQVWCKFGGVGAERYFHCAAHTVQSVITVIIFFLGLALKFLNQQYRLNRLSSPPDLDSRLFGTEDTPLAGQEQPRMVLFNLFL
jgi:hypothetical protein